VVGDSTPGYRWFEVSTSELAPTGLKILAASEVEIDKLLSSVPLRNSSASPVTS